MFHSFAQEKVDPENYRLDVPNAPTEKKRHAQVGLINGQKLKGTIISIGENSIQLENVVYKNPKGGGSLDPQKSIPFNEINYNDIQYISIRATAGTTFKGFLKGTGMGTLFVGVLGGVRLAVDCETCNLEEGVGLILFFGSIGAVIGGPVGAVFAARETYIIKGQDDNFERFKNKMKGKAMKKSRRKGKK